MESETDLYQQDLKNSDSIVYLLLSELLAQQSAHSNILYEQLYKPCFNVGKLIIGCIPGDGSHINSVKKNINIPGREPHVPLLSYYAGGNPAPFAVQR